MLIWYHDQGVRRQVPRSTGIFNFFLPPNREVFFFCFFFPVCFFGDAFSLPRKTPGEVVFYLYIYIYLFWWANGVSWDKDPPKNRSMKWVAWIWKLLRPYSPKNWYRTLRLCEFLVGYKHLILRHFNLLPMDLLRSSFWEVWQFLLVFLQPHDLMPKLFFCSPRDSTLYKMNMLLHKKIPNWCHFIEWTFLDFRNPFLKICGANVWAFYSSVFFHEQLVQAFYSIDNHVLEHGANVDGFEDGVSKLYTWSWKIQKSLDEESF